MGGGGDGGHYAWHDHRIHWMTPDQPPPVVQGEPVEVMTWTVPVVVDGEPADVMGTLQWFPAVSPLPALGVGLVAAVPVLISVEGESLPRRRHRDGSGRRRRAGGGLLAARGVAARCRGESSSSGHLRHWRWSARPPRCCFDAAAPKSPSCRVVGGAVLLIVWALLRLSTLWMPSLPSGLPVGVERALLAITVVLALVGLAISDIGTSALG